MSNLMPKMDKSERRSTLQTEGEAESIALDQMAAGQSYVRLRLRYDHGDLSVVGVKRVPGPLISKDILEEGFVYEVRRSSRRVYAETIPDLGVQRSFPPPNGEETADVRGHHITELETYEFNVRIPASEFTPRSIRYLQITLYETTEIPESPRMDARPLKTQFDKNLREVSALKGINKMKLPSEVRKEIEKSLK